MTHFDAGSDPAIVGAIMVSACILALGFMVRFLVALRVATRKLHAVHVLHPRSVHSEAESNGVPSRKPAFVAIGVVRITAALASNAERKRSEPPVPRPKVVTLNRPSPEISSQGEHHYRSG